MKQLTKLMEEMKQGVYRDTLKDIYIDESVIAHQEERYVKAMAEYQKLYGDREVEVYSAPGRSEVGGNHTDHQHGMVLATSINLDAIAIVNKNEDMTVRVVSEGYDMIVIDANDVEKVDKEEGTSIGLIRGVLAGLKERGYKIGGFNAYATSDVLVGAGLSSSAAFEVVVGTIISGLYNDMKINSVEIAQISQYAENVFFKKPCGLMDQMACSVGGMVNIDFKDPTKPIVKKVPTEFEKYDYSLCIVDTKGDHVDLTDDYAMIPSEMKKVANFLGEDYLRDCDSNEFYIRLDEIREAVGDRPVLRAIHFFNEEHNVKNAVSSLENGKFVEFLDAIRKSGNSSFKYLQNVYTTRDIQHQNISVALALSESLLRNYGVCRVHGGGFAGTIQAFVKNDFVSNYKEFINKIFGENSCHVLKVRKYGGIKVM